jgi:hypothetical protein
VLLKKYVNLGEMRDYAVNRILYRRDSLEKKNARYTWAAEDLVALGFDIISTVTYIKVFRVDAILPSSGVSQPGKSLMGPHDREFGGTTIPSIYRSTKKLENSKRRKIFTERT